MTCGNAIQMPHFAIGLTETTDVKVRNKAAGWIVAAIVSVILLGCLMIAMVRVGGRTMNRLTTSRERSTSIANLEKIADALNAYAADHGTYPPPATLDAANRQLHSWRVLILPYLGEEELYDSFDLTQPWDSRINMKAANDMPTVYQHPNRGSGIGYLESGYYLIVGPGTLFPLAGPLGPDQITDNPSQTILVTEAAPIVPSGMWTEPVDMDFSKMQGKLGTSPGIEPGGLLDDGVAFSTTDGRGHFVPNSFDPLIFRSLVTPRGGERMRDDTLD